MLPRRPRPASQVIFNRTEEEDKAEETATWKVAAAIYNSATLHGGDQDSGQRSLSSTAEEVNPSSNKTEKLNSIVSNNKTKKNKTARDQQIRIIMQEFVNHTKKNGEDSKPPFWNLNNTTLK